MKAVLTSIKPKWCELIASGKKTIEVRKTRPKLKTPFKCYIYCTQEYDGSYLYINEPKAREHGITMRWSANAKETQDYGFNGNSYLSYKACGKVIGEFVCDKIYAIKRSCNGFMIDNDIALTNRIARESCLQFDDLQIYLGKKDGYAWHISDLKIYDKPRELGEFERPADAGLCDKYDCDECESSYYKGNFDGVPTYGCKKFIITRPPQSWCYVEG